MHGSRVVGIMKAPDIDEVLIFQFLLAIVDCTHTKPENKILRTYL